MHEQLTHAQRVLIEDVALFIRRNVHAAHENLTVLERTVGIFEIDLSQTDRLYLGTRKLDARFILFLDKVVMPCLFVGRNLLCACLLYTSAVRYADKLDKCNKGKSWGEVEAALRKSKEYFDYSKKNKPKWCRKIEEGIDNTCLLYTSCLRILKLERKCCRMASKTTNYGLNKHSPQDFYNVEARNENWDKIDTELKNNVDAVNARVKPAELAAEVKKGCQGRQSDCC